MTGEFDSIISGNLNFPVVPLFDDREEPEEGSVGHPGMILEAGEILDEAAVLFFFEPRIVGDMVMKVLVRDNDIEFRKVEGDIYFFFRIQKILREVDETIGAEELDFGRLRNLGSKQADIFFIEMRGGVEWSLLKKKGGDRVAV